MCHGFLHICKKCNTEQSAYSFGSNAVVVNLMAGVAGLTDIIVFAEVMPPGRLQHKAVWVHIKNEEFRDVWFISVFYMIKSLFGNVRVTYTGIRQNMKPAWQTISYTSVSATQNIRPWSIFFIWQ